VYTWKATKYVASTTADISVASGVHTWNATKYLAGKTADVSVGAYKYMFPSINVSLDNYHTEVRINEMQWGDKMFYIPNYKLKCKDIIRAP
jgi:hypothetical protein